MSVNVGLTLLAVVVGCMYFQHIEFGLLAIDCSPHFLIIITPSIIILIPHMNGQWTLMYIIINMF